MKKPFLLLIGTLLINSAAFAGGAGDHTHATDGGEEDIDMIAVGKEGEAADVTRTIEVVMVDRGGHKQFQPSSITIHKGQTIRLSVENKSSVDHDFILDRHDILMEFKVIKDKFPEIKHEEPNSLHLKSGGKGELIWKFANSGNFEFACLTPGHYDVGMKGSVKVITQ